MRAASVLAASCALTVCMLVEPGCAHDPAARKLKRASRELGKAVKRADAGEIRAWMVPGSRPTADTNAMLSGPAKKSWARALRKPERVQPSAIIFVAPDLPVRVVWIDGGWRFDEDPTDLYAQDTARHALRALVLASRHQRWDVLLGLAPKRYRMGLSAQDLQTAWTQGEHAAVLNAARDRVAAHLADPIVSDAHEAVLELGPEHVARLEREGDRWVIVDFLPETP